LSGGRPAWRFSGTGCQTPEARREVAGFVRRAASLKDCEKAGAVDFATTDLLAAVSNADLVILCMPLSQMQSRVRQMLPALKRGAIVTDVGSVKASVVRELESLVARSGAHFVGSHPMAGSEKTGVNAACAGFVCERRLHRDANKKIKHIGDPQSGTILEGGGFASVGIEAGNPRRAGEPVESFATRRCGDFGQPCLESGTTEASNRALRQRVSRHNAHCVRVARNVARHLAGQQEKHWQITDAFIADLRKFRRALAKADVNDIARFFQGSQERRDNWCACCASPSPE